MLYRLCTAIGQYAIYRHCTAIAPFWFSTEHCWIAIMPFWLSTFHKEKSKKGSGRRRMNAGNSTREEAYKPQFPLFVQNIKILFENKLLYSTCIYIWEVGMHSAGIWKFFFTCYALGKLFLQHHCLLWSNTLDDQIRTLP